MKRLILILSILLSPLFLAQGQTDNQNKELQDALKELSRLVLSKDSVSGCDITIDHVPLIRGLRLGQPYEHLQKVLPRRLHTVDLKPDEIGLQRVLISPSSVVDPKSMAGVLMISLVYLDDSLSSIDITYDTSVQWQSSLHFAAAIAEQLNLPHQGWRQENPTFLVCQGFFIEASGATAFPKLRIVDLRFGEELIKRKAEVEEKKRARFRP